MNKNKKTTQLVVLVAAASSALGVVFMGDFLKGGKVTLATDTPTAKTLRSAMARQLPLRSLTMSMSVRFMVFGRTLTEAKMRLSLIPQPPLMKL